MAGMFDLTGEVALVTGASRGIGAALAMALYQNGAKVALIARRSEGLANIFGESAKGYVFDIKQSSEISTLFDRVEHDLGTVSILINNAGRGHVNRSTMLPTAVWDEILDVDLKAPFLLSREFANRVIKRGANAAVIVNVGSIFGQLGSKGMLAYATAKAGLMQMTRALAMEWGEHGIRVNALCPGWCVTDLTRSYLDTPRGRTIKQDIPLGRFAAPDDLIGPTLLLVSDAGRYVTGTTIVVDGGLSIAMRDGRNREY